MENGFQYIIPVFAPGHYMNISSCGGSRVETRHLKETKQDSFEHSQHTSDRTLTYSKTGPSIQT